MTKLTTIEDRALVLALNDFAEIQARLISQFISEVINRSFLSKRINLHGQSQSEPVMSYMPNLEFKPSLVTSGVFNSSAASLRDSDLLGKPRRGTISTLGEEWQFTRHGAGILFVSNQSKKIIDAHREVFSYPRSFDAWRLSQYFESLNCSEIVWKSTTFAANDDDDLAHLLELLEQESTLKLVSAEYRLYQLTNSL